MVLAELSGPGGGQVVRALRGLTVKRGTLGWIGLVAYVSLWDSLASETLSRALWRGLENPKSRPVVLFCWLWLTSHLLFRRPKKILVRW